MGRSSVSMLNKVGHSMFWGSMWDNKISFSRHLKEDMYLNNFFDLIFVDNLSMNVFNVRKRRYKKHFNPFFHIPNKSDFNLYKYLKSSSKIESFNSKVWILRYQNWIIIYNFVYLKKFGLNSKFIVKKNSNYIYNNNFSYIYNLYQKINKNLRISYNLFNKNKKKVFF